MAKLKIGIAAKLSKLEWDMHRLGLSREQAIDSYKREGMDIQKILSSHERQKKSIDTLLSVAKGAELVDMVEVPRGADRPELDVLLAIGGDNFFQLSAHYFPEAYIVGVNSDPQTSLGALLYYNYSSLIPKLSSIQDGNFRTEHWTTIATTLNGKRIEDTFCTLALSIKATDMMSRYLLSTQEGQEEQKSTGWMLVSGAGSGNHSWYSTSGLYLPQIGSGLYKTIAEPFSRISKILKTLTREPFGGKLCSYKLLNYTLHPEEEITLVYWAQDPSELSLDSIRRYDVREGDHLSFRISEHPLKVVARD